MTIAEELKAIREQIEALGSAFEVQEEPRILSLEELREIRSSEENDMAARIDGVGCEYQIFDMGFTGDNFLAVACPTSGPAGADNYYRCPVVAENTTYIRALLACVADIENDSK